MSLTVPDSASVLSWVRPPLVIVVVEPVLVPIVALIVSLGAVVSTVAVTAAVVVVLPALSVALGREGQLELYHRSTGGRQPQLHGMATDNAGNTTTTAAVTATVDTTAPSETISATIGTNSGSTTTITSGGLTHDNTLALWAR